MVGGLVGQPRLGARPAAVRARRRRATSPPAGAAHADRRRGGRALRGARAPRRPAASASSARRSGRRRAGRARRAAPAELAAARFDREPRPALAADVLQRHHGRRARGAGRRASRRRRSSTDEPAPPAPLRPPPRRPRGRRAARDAVAAGRRCRSASHVGTFVHRVLEATDFAARRPRRRARRARRRRRRRGARSTIGDPAAVVAGPARGDRDAARPAARRRCGCATSRARDRLDELDFELPLAGGDEPTGRLAPGGDRRACCARTCRRATRSPATPTGSTTRRCAASVRGYLTGSIDLVVRAAGGDPRFAVVDYKTNWLGAPGRGADARGTTARPRSPPRWSARTTACRRCSTPSRCTATCAGGCPATTRSATSPACSTCSCAG